MDNKGLRLVNGNYDNRSIRTNVIEMFTDKPGISVLTMASGITELSKVRAKKIVTIDDLHCPDNNAA